MRSPTTSWTVGVELVEVFRLARQQRDPEERRLQFLGGLGRGHVAKDPGAPRDLVLLVDRNRGAREEAAVAKRDRVARPRLQRILVKVSHVGRERIPVDDENGGPAQQLRVVRIPGDLIRDAPDFAEAPVVRHHPAVEADDQDAVECRFLLRLENRGSVLARPSAGFSRHDDANSTRARRARSSRDEAVGERWTGSLLIRVKLHGLYQPTLTTVYLSDCVGNGACGMRHESRGIGMGHGCSASRELLAEASSTHAPCPMPHAFTSIARIPVLPKVLPLLPRHPDVPGDEEREEEEADVDAEGHDRGADDDRDPDRDDECRVGRGGRSGGSSGRCGLRRAGGTGIRLKSPTRGWRCGRSGRNEASIGSLAPSARSTSIVS